MTLPPGNKELTQNDNLVQLQYEKKDKNVWQRNNVCRCNLNILVFCVVPEKQRALRKGRRRVWRCHGNKIWWVLEDYFLRINFPDYAMICLGVVWQKLFSVVPFQLCSDTSPPQWKLLITWSVTAAGTYDMTMIVGSGYRSGLTSQKTPQSSPSQVRSEVSYVSIWEKNDC